MKRLWIFIIFLFVFNINLMASSGTNEWSGSWPYCSDPGKFIITEYSIPGTTVITPLATNVLIQKFSIRNNIASTNNLPIFSSVRIDLIGTASDSDISNVHLYFDKDGVWMSGDEQELQTNIICNEILATKFARNYSPVQFENKIAIFGELGVDEIGLHLPWSNTYYFYVTIDASEKITDKATVDFRIYGVKMFMNVGCYWEQNMANVDTDINARFNVTATKLDLYGEPPAPGINADTAFSLTVQALDDYNNIDKEYTGAVYFICTDPHGTVPYTLASPYTFKLTDNGVRTFNNFKLMTGPQENITVSDGPASGLIDHVSEDIIVLADVDHFKLIGDGTNLPYEPAITAGQDLSVLGLTNITVTAYNYLSAIIPDYTGSIYFYSSLQGEYDSFPAEIDNKYTFQGIGIDDGSHDFSATDFILTKAGEQNLLVSDANGGHTGEWLNITVLPANYAKLRIECKSNVTASSFFDLSVTATDPYGNEVTGKSTYLKLELERLDDVSDKPIKAVYPTGNLKLTGGEMTIQDSDSIKISEGGCFRLKVTDVNNPNITVYQNLYVNITVEGTKSSSLAYNYIHPDTDPVVDIYYNNLTSSELDVEVEIYTINGKCVKKFASQTVSPGVNRLKSWDILNDLGNQVVSGTYLAVIKDGITVEKHFIIVVR